MLNVKPINFKFDLYYEYQQFWWSCNVTCGSMYEAVTTSFKIKVVGIIIYEVRILLQQKNEKLISSMQYFIFLLVYLR